MSRLAVSPAVAVSSALAVVLVAGTTARAQWNPIAGQWGKTDPRDVRVMTYNIRDGIDTTQPKVEGFNAWTALARTVAALKPDVLLLQEAADTGSGADTVAELTTVLNLFLRGGTDPFNGNSAVTSWVQKYAPSYDLPMIYVSNQTDGFNRNVVLSRFPLTDLTGDGRNAIDRFTMSADLYVPSGGDSGIRGFIYAELNLPDASYAGDLVIGCAHFKSGSTTQDIADRLIAAQRNAYYIDYMFNGGGGPTPDPRNRISDIPLATRVLTSTTPVIWGGDWNEDENTNGRDGPALWMTRAQVAGGTDGTDRDRTDSIFDDARDFFNNSRVTLGSSKLDYIAWQDSIATLRRAHVFNSASINAAGATFPAELIGFNGSQPSLVTATASDHRPVFADFILPAPVPQPPGAFSLLTPANGAINQPLQPTLTWSAATGASTYTVRISLSPALTSPIHTSPAQAGTSYVVPASVLSECGTYYWGVFATNGSGNTNSTPLSFELKTIVPADFNQDGAVDFFDYLDFVAAYDSEDASADFNGDSTIDFFDYLDFVGRFDVGC